MNTSPIHHQVALLYDELKRLAGSHIRRERSEHTLSATALVNEAFLRLAQSNPGWDSRAHFMGIAANTMRRVLVDHARARSADKRGGDWLRLTLTLSHPEIGQQAQASPDAAELLSLNRALDELAERDPRQAQIVELRYFAGLSIEETAAVLALSTATIKREWLVAKLFLKRALDV